MLHVEYDPRSYLINRIEEVPCTEYSVALGTQNVVHSGTRKPFIDYILTVLPSKSKFGFTFTFKIIHQSFHQILFIHDAVSIGEQSRDKEIMQKYQGYQEIVVDCFVWIISKQCIATISTGSATIPDKTMSLTVPVSGQSPYVPVKASPKAS